MSVQLVKWFILTFALCAIMVATCRISTVTDTLIRQEFTTVSINHASHNLFDSFLSLLRGNAADLVKEMSHPTFDKKALTCLLIYLNYHFTHFAEGYQDRFTVNVFPDALPDQTQYFVYTLHRIIV